MDGRTGARRGETRDNVPMTVPHPGPVHGQAYGRVRRIVGSMIALSAAACLSIPATADTRCYAAKGREQQRCLRYEDFERRESCIRRAERALDRCIVNAEPPATRPLMDVLPEPQPARDQCPPRAGGAPVPCRLHVDTIVMPHVEAADEDG